jgi:hypothetical protein
VEAGFLPWLEYAWGWVPVPKKSHRVLEICDCCLKLSTACAAVWWYLQFFVVAGPVCV